MAALLAILFIGITFLAVHFGIVPIEEPTKQTVISQVAAPSTATAIPFYLFQAFTALLLFLAANTSFNAFPRCSRSSPPTATCPASSRCAATGWPSRTGSSCWRVSPRRSIVVFKGETHVLIPLYAVGVFIDFTISQSGMIRHWLRERTPRLAAATVDQRLRRAA